MIIGKFLGLGVGMAMGAAVFAAPASAALINQTTVEKVDLFLGSCDTASVASGIAGEIECLNSVLLSNGILQSFSTSDADDVPLNFMQVDWDNDGTLESATFAGSTQDGVVFGDGWDADDGIIWSTDTTFSGGFFSVKTGALDCNGGGDIPSGCTTLPQQYIIFQNLSSSNYLTIDFLSLWFDEGIFLKNVGKISHITIVPLPGAALLFGSALLGGGLMRRRKVIKKLGLPS